ncbi:hypothetical protein Ddye_001725 [Dipteronia dyeriana]|uniref:Reverse transcriptase domain-containing protein n=1 Tax=Dipteronia dyeriana TaxID=168575 RepID=A0AAD9XNY6_9ROSI|nr:hypothetical protein Ddye_001725 [Dipteronia dyeriana]
MSIISSNIRGLGRPEKCKAVRNIVCIHKLSLLFLQETKLKHFNLRTIKPLGGSLLSKGVGVDSTGSTGGLLMLWDDEVFVVSDCITNDRCIIVFGMLSKFKNEVTFCNVYAANQEEDRRVLWQYFSMRNLFCLTFGLLVVISIRCWNKVKRPSWLAGHGSEAEKERLFGQDLDEHLSRVIEMEEMVQGQVVKGMRSKHQDDFNLNFIRSNWEVVKNDFLGFMEEFHNDSSVVKHVNRTFIALVPKTRNPEYLKGYRPISLVGATYKILAKVLANRLKKVMVKIISQFQMAFVSGRQIVNSFVIADEMIHSWKKSDMGRILLKLDFEKAYDSVNNDSCLRCSVEVLSCLLVKAREKGLMKGIGFQNDEVHLTHLQFADDTLLFIEPCLPLGGNFVREGSSFVKFVNKFCDKCSASTRIIKEGFSVVVGSEERVRFWKDLGWDSSPLMHAFVRIFALAFNKIGLVCKYGKWEGACWSWVVQLRRQPFNWEFSQWNCFMMTLISIHIMGISWVLWHGLSVQIGIFRLSRFEGTMRRMEAW